MTCPHCLGRVCIHCREQRRELARRRPRSRLTDEDRRHLGLFLRRPLRAVIPRHQEAVQGAHRMTPVLPADFCLLALTGRGT
jgi:hypothetical protein